MSFEVIPAIDLIGGRCVRLTQGRYDAETVYDADPVQVAKRWKQCGAGRLHIVDLDGARLGTPQHIELLARIADTTGLPIQYGGGLRDETSVEHVLQSGARWAILGTGAIQDPDFLERCARRWPDRILVSLDLRDGQPAVRGWLQSSEKDLADVLLQLKSLRLLEVIVTDINLDGTLSGVQGHVATSVAARGFRVILAGGVRDVQDIRTALALAGGDGQSGIMGVIAGRAIYAGTLDLAEAVRIARGG